MSREGSLCRARAQAHFVEEAIAQGAGIYLLGCPIVVLFNEKSRPAAAWPRAELGEPQPAVANESAATVAAAPPTLSDSRPRPGRQPRVEARLPAPGAS